MTYDSATTTPALVYQVTATNPAMVSGTSPVSDSKSLTINAVSNLSATLSDSATSYTPGLGGQFIATVTNSGPSDVSGLTVVDNAISDFDSISWSCTITDVSMSVRNCTNNTDTIAIDTTVDLAAGEVAEYVIDVTYDSATVTNPLVYSITAENPAGVNGTSPVTATDNDDDLDRQVDLSITKVGKVGTLVPNEPFTYTIIVSNAGPSDLGAAVDMMGVPTEDGVILEDFIDTTLLDHPSLCTFENAFPCWEYCSSDLGANDTDISPDDCPVGAEVIAGYEDDELTPQTHHFAIPVRLSSGSSSEIRIHTRVSESSGSNCESGTFGVTDEVCNQASITLAEPLTTSNSGPDTLTASTFNIIEIGTDLVVTKTDDKTDAAPGLKIAIQLQLEMMALLMQME